MQKTLSYFVELKFEYNDVNLRTAIIVFVIILNSKIQFKYARKFYDSDEY